MADNIIDELVDAVAIADGELTKLFMPDGTTLKLLKMSETLDEFTTIQTLANDAGWLIEYGEFRNTAILEISINDATFNANIITATHFQIFDLDEDSIYKSVASDPKKVKGFDPYWRFNLELFDNQMGMRTV